MDEKDLEELAAALLVWLWGDEEEIKKRVGTVMEVATVEVASLPVQGA